MIAQALADFDESKAMITVVKSYGSFTLAVDGIGKVEEAHKQVKRLRIDIDGRRKSLTAGALTYQRAINAEAKRLTEEVEPIEAALAGQRAIHDAEKEREREEKAKAKRAVLQDRIEKLAQAGCLAGDVAALELMSDDEFSLHFLQERMKSEIAHAKAEESRIVAEKLEADRLAEIERQAEELRIRREELEADRKAMAAEREAMLHQQSVQQRQILEQQEEVRRQQEEIRIEQEAKAEADRQRVLAERRAEDDRLAAIAAAEAEVTRLARLEDLRPEIEKCDQFTMRLNEWADNYLTSIGRPRWSNAALASIERACSGIRRDIERGEG